MTEQQHTHSHTNHSPAKDFNPKIAVRFEMDAQNRITHLEVNGIRHSASPIAGDLGGTLSEAHHMMASEERDSTRFDRAGKLLLMTQTRNGIYTIGLLVMVEALIEALWFQKDPELLEGYVWWIFYLDISVVSLVVMIGYLRSYRYASTNHMISMMIGMTVGMQVGMMSGGVIGATDGYFMGALVGVGLGTLLGVGTAWCCGPMAITQALMSAVMGGTMGSMIVAMMPPENLIVFMPLFTLLNIAILLWFSFLFFKDCVIGERCAQGRVIPFRMTFLISLLAVTGLGSLMIINPEHSDHFRNPENKGANSAGNPFKIGETQNSIKKATAQGEMKCGAGMMRPEITPKNP